MDCFGNRCIKNNNLTLQISALSSCSAELICIVMFHSIVIAGFSLVQIPPAFLSLDLMLSLCVALRVTQKAIWNPIWAAIVFWLSCKNVNGIAFQTTSKCGLNQIFPDFPDWVPKTHIDKIWTCKKKSASLNLVTLNVNGCWCQTCWSEYFRNC